LRSKKKIDPTIDAVTAPATIVLPFKVVVIQALSVPTMSWTCWKRELIMRSELEFEGLYRGCIALTT
jgi:hypothetical protein